MSAAAIQQKQADFREYKRQRFSVGRKKKIGQPSYKSRRGRQSFRLPNQKFTLAGNRIRLEKIGAVRIALDRQPVGKFMSVTVSMDHCGSYYASILMEQDICPKPKTGKTVGIDVGLKSLITTSDGLQVSMPRENQAGIKHMQRIMSRKIKGSVRHRKNKLRVAKMHRKIARQREWLAHNITAHLVETYDAIAVEDLNVAGMVKNHRLAGLYQMPHGQPLLLKLNTSAGYTESR